MIDFSNNRDLKALGYTVRPLNGPNDKVYDYEYKIALCVGTTAIFYRDDNGNLYYFYDYHLMCQVSTGQWAEKHGTGGDSILWPHGINPNHISWDFPGVMEDYYDNGPLYFAIGKPVE